MSVNLKKNQSVSLAKTAGLNLSKIKIGLGWAPAKAAKKGFLSAIFSGGSAEEIDLDASCILLDRTGKELDVIWFRQLASRCGSIIHYGDDLTGSGDGDDEVISVNLAALNSNVAHIAITVNSFRGQTFNEVERAYCRITDDNDKELVRFPLSEQGSHTGILIASLTRDSGDWMFSTHGLPTNSQTVSGMLNLIKQALNL